MSHPMQAEIDAHLDSLGEGHFLNVDGPAPLFVRHVDGEPVAAFVDGEIVPIDKWRSSPKADPHTASSIAPRKEFAVTIDMQLPAIEEMLGGLPIAGAIAADLPTLLAAAGPGHFLHLVDGCHALVVEDATGIPKYRIEDGKLAPILK